MDRCSVILLWGSYTSEENMAVEVNMYRPEGWIDILRKKTEEWNADPPEWTFDNFIELGADAMLEGLKKEGIHIKGVKGWEYLEESYNAWLHGNKTGWVVFIEE